MITFKSLPQMRMYEQKKNVVVDALLLHNWVEEATITNLIIPEIKTGYTVL